MPDYAPTEPPRAEIDATRGPLVIEFGTSWCSICAAAQPAIVAALATRPGVPHMKIGDGPGQPLGRSFRVKLWPTLIFLRDGVEVDRLVRPTGSAPIAAALARVAASA